MKQTRENLRRRHALSFGLPEDAEWGEIKAEINKLGPDSIMRAEDILDQIFRDLGEMPC